MGKKQRNEFPEYELPYESFIGGWFIPPEICDGVVDVFNEVQDLEKGPGVIFGNMLDPNVKESTDLCIPASSSFSNPKWKNYIMTLVDVFDTYLDKYFESMPNAKIGFREGHNIQHYPKGGGYKIFHCERSRMDPVQLCRHLVYMTYLNDVEEGGQTEFKYQKLFVKPQKGLTLIWPSDWTHTHRGIPSLTEEKMIVTGWLHYVD